jgi:hypothetical protein
MKLEGSHFQNSPRCEGVAYSDESASVDMAIIDISGRYPEHGWAVNEIVHEMVYVSRGMGRLAVKGMETISLNEGDVVSIASGKRFAWDGEMTLVMVCNPPFTSSQYKMEESR